MTGPGAGKTSGPLSDDRTGDARPAAASTVRETPDTSQPENPSGFTAELRALCLERCAAYGDPACWRLPSLVTPCEPITPCAECLAGKPVNYEDL